MNRAFLKTVKLLDNLLKSRVRMLTTNRNSNKPVVVLPLYISKTFFASDDKPVEPTLKTTISSLISTDYSKMQKPVRTLLEEAEETETREASWRTMKYTLVFLGISFVCIGSYLVIEFGKPHTGDDGSIMQDEFSTMPTWQQYLYRTLREIDYYKRLIKEPSREKLLPDELEVPFYQPAYTLVLELTDVLVHPDWTYQTGWRFKKRPGIEYFLETLSGPYEIVVYTAEQGMTVFPIIEALDPKNLIMYKLVRDATHFVDGCHVKNLDKLNRNLKKVIVIDWNMDSVKFHPENVFHVSRWSGNDDDTTLVDLTAFLMTVATSEVDDVRQVLNYYNSFDDGLSVFREKQRMLLEQQEAEKEVQQQSAFPTKNWSQSFSEKRSPIIPKSKY